VLEALSKGLFGVRKHELDAYSVRISRAGAIAWQIERRAGCTPARPIFPLTYGSLPDCYVQLAPAEPLRPDTLYQVETRDEYGEGYFRPAPTPIYFDRSEVEEQLEGFPDGGPPAPEITGDTNLLSANTVLEVPSE